MSAGIVLFDAGGTLFTEVETRDQAYARVLAGHGITADIERLARLRAEVHDGMPERFAGMPRYTDPWFLEFVRRLLRELGAAGDADAIRRELAGHFQRPESYAVYADALPALEELGAAGLRLGVVSNWSARLPALLEAFGLARHFEVVAVSAIVGASKPDRALFQHALRRFGAAPGEVLHVGDHPVNDLFGARRAGLSALLLDRQGARPADASAIRSLDELPARCARTH